MCLNLSYLYSQCIMCGIDVLYCTIYFCNNYFIYLYIDVSLIYLKRGLNFENKRCHCQCGLG